MIMNEGPVLSEHNHPRKCVVTGSRRKQRKRTDHCFLRYRYVYVFWGNRSWSLTIILLAPPTAICGTFPSPAICKKQKNITICSYVPACLSHFPPKQRKGQQKTLMIFIVSSGYICFIIFRISCRCFQYPYKWPKRFGLKATPINL